MRIINSRARRDYQILEKTETGIVLTGPEVKSIRGKHLDIKEAFVKIKDNEAWLFNALIPPYQPKNLENYDPRRPRKLLLHKREILRLRQKTIQKNLTIIPLVCYNKGRNIKLKIALAKSKKKYQKKREIRKKEQEQEIRRQLRRKK